MPHKVRCAGRVLELFVRAGTTDQTLVAMILHAGGEYRFAPIVQPRIIFDIGANIGVAAVYFAVVYSQARIFCFEPLPENVELLRANVQAFGPRVSVLDYGLSDVSDNLAYDMSDDAHSFGGGEFCGLGNDSARRQHLPVKTVQDVLAELNLSGVDLFKIDTEGSELAILRGMSEAVRRGAEAFIGEPHGLGGW